ncbi:hypothetical protein Tco_1366221 [Tanacetum coccineum]
MIWFKQPEIHLSYLYHNSLSHDVDAYKPVFRTFFSEVHQTFRLRMFHNLDQLRLQFEKENLYKVNAKNYLEDYTYSNPETYRHDLLKNLDILGDFIDKSVIKYGELRMEENEINPVQAVDASLVVTKSSGIELENNSSENALNKSVNETQMRMQEGKVDIGKALDVGSVVT